MEKGLKILVEGIRLTRDNVNHKPPNSYFPLGWLAIKASRDTVSWQEVRQIFEWGLVPYWSSRNFDYLPYEYVHDSNFMLLQLIIEFRFVVVERVFQNMFDFGMFIGRPKSEQCIRFLFECGAKLPVDPTLKGRPDIHLTPYQRDKKESLKELRCIYEDVCRRRDECRAATMAFLGMAKHWRRGERDVLRIIASLVWRTRHDDAWFKSPEWWQARVK
jgi:hypothetical protein